MIVVCVECNQENDLTALYVRTGHVFDCERCNKQLRVFGFDDNYTSKLVSDQADYWLEQAKQTENMRMQARKNS